MSNHTMSAFSEGLVEAADRAGRGVVLVNGRRRFPASGVVLRPGVVLTADHVLERDEEITVAFADDSEAAASVAGRDSGSDLAVLKLDTEIGEPISAAEVDARVAELVLALGRPDLSGLQASLGIVTAVRGFMRVSGRHRGRRHGHGHGRSRGKGRGHRRKMSDPFIHTDAIPYPGFSGGPLVNASGEMLGLNTSGLVRGTSLAVPAARAFSIGADLLEHGSVRRGYLGIRSQHTPLDEKQQETIGRDQEAGLLIVWIEDGSPAAEAGLIVGDILVGAADVELDDHISLQGVLGPDTVGQPLELEILRGGEQRRLPVTVGTK